MGSLSEKCLLYYSKQYQQLSWDINWYFMFFPLPADPLCYYSLNFKCFGDLSEKRNYGDNTSQAVQ